jgi:hypothetical protein
MTHRLCSTSRLHRLLGNRLIDTPEDLGVPALAHIYEIQADRIRSEPLDKADTPFIKVRIAASHLTRQMGRRVGPPTSYALVVVMAAGMAIIGAIYGAKAGVAHVEAAHAQAKAHAEACASFRAIHMSPLPAYCK